MSISNKSRFKTTLLYVSDDKFMHLIINDTLSKRNVDVCDVYSVDQALEKLKTISPDLILSDIDLPGLSGFDLCKILKAGPSTAKLPVVIYSASESEETILEAFKAGAKGFVIKKYKNEELADKILKYIV